MKDTDMASVTFDIVHEIIEKAKIKNLNSAQIISMLLAIFITFSAREDLMDEESFRLLLDEGLETFKKLRKMEEENGRK